MSNDGSSFIAAIIIAIGGVWYYVLSISKENTKLKNKLSDLERENSSLKSSSRLTIEHIKENHTQEIESANLELSKAHKEINDLRQHMFLEVDNRKKISLSLDQAIRMRNVDLQKIKNDNALLPYVIECLKMFEERLDSVDAEILLKKNRPAPAASDAVKEAKAEAREWRKEARIYKNQVALYEAHAPWLSELIDVPIKDISDGLREAEATRDTSSKDDPAMRYLTTTEWASLSSTQRNQIALDRYFESRQKNAFLAGVAYERFIGSTYEPDGFKVTYYGALNGVNDLGIDLICEIDGFFHIVQCKRYSESKGIPVRENVVAQIYGAAKFFAYSKGIDPGNVVPCIHTTYILSGEARKFADSLGVEYYERVKFKKYPAIKCNISRTGEKIYHLPFDQQYDKTGINYKDGDCYVSTVQEAESKGFRRAYRWSGATS